MNTDERLRLLVRSHWRKPCSTATPCSGVLVKTNSRESIELAKSQATAIKGTAHGEGEEDVTG